MDKEEILNDLVKLASNPLDISSVAKFFAYFHSFFLKSEFDETRWRLFLSIINSNALGTAVSWLSLLAFRRIVTEHWNNLSNEMTSFFFNIVSSEIVDWSNKTYESTSGDHPFLLVLDSIFVQIVEYDWLLKYENFPMAVFEQNCTPALSKNTFRIFSMLAEDIVINNNTFESYRRKQLKNGLISMSGKIIKNYLALPDNSQTRVRYEALTCLSKYVCLDPAVYKENSFIFSNILDDYFSYTIFQVPILRIIYEIINVQNHDEETVNKIIKLINFLFSKVKKTFRKEALSLENREFFLLFSNIISKFVIKFFLSNKTNKNANGDCINNNNNNNENNNLSFNIYSTPIKKNSNFFEQVFSTAVSFAINLVKFDDSDIFFSCCKLFHQISRCLTNSNDEKVDFLKCYFPAIVESLVKGIPCPFDMLYAIDEKGVLVCEEVMINRDLYQIIKEALQNFTKNDSSLIKRVISEIFPKVSKSHVFTELFPYYWSAGAVSGVMPKNEENGFVIKMVKNLLLLFELSDSISQNIVISSCFLFFVPQFPNFLLTYKDYGKTFIEKVFEYLVDTDHMVSNMTVSAFSCLVSNCSDFFLLKDNEADSVFDNIIRQFSKLIKNLSNETLTKFYSLISKIIGSEGKDTNRQYHISLLQAAVKRFVDDPLLFLEIQFAIQKEIGSTFSTQFDTILPIIISQIKGISFSPQDKENTCRQRRVMSLSFKIIKKHFSDSERQTISHEVVFSTVFSAISNYISIGGYPTKTMFQFLTEVATKMPSILSEKSEKIIEVIVEPSIKMLEDYQQPKFNISILNFISEFMRNCLDNPEKFNEKDVDILFKIILLNSSNVLSSIAEVGFNVFLQLFEKIKQNKEKFVQFLGKYYVYSYQCLVNQFKASHTWSDDTSVIKFFLFFISDPVLSPHFGDIFNNDMKSVLKEIIGTINSKKNSCCNNNGVHNCAVICDHIILEKIRDFRVMIRYTSF